MVIKIILLNKVNILKMFDKTAVKDSLTDKFYRNFYPRFAYSCN